MIQVGLLADFFQRPRPPKGLSSPHPLDGNGPVAVWMLDDDLRLERLELAGQRLSCTPLVDLRRTLDHLYREYPEISVLVGGNTGCPPIPGFCFLYTQIVDIAAHVKSASQQDPNAPYRARSNPRHLPDYYYDTSESGDEHLALAFDWEPDAASASLSVREALLSHLRAFSNLLHGQPATRLLVHHPDLPISPTTARGGNAIFFDLDALFAAPYLSIPLADGIKSRRGDTVWAHLAAAVSGVSVYQAPFAVHHVRHAADGSGPSLGQSPGGSSLEQFILAQIGGVVLSRLVAAQLQGREASPLVLLEQRIGRVRTAFSAAVAHIESFSAARYRERTELWWARMQDRAVLAELARLTEVLEILRAGVLSFAPTEELQTIVKSLAGAMSTLSEKTLRWRSLWT